MAAFPLCFADKREWERWRYQARAAHYELPGTNAHCEDCTRAYQWRMLLEGRCENPAANPETHE